MRKALEKYIPDGETLLAGIRAVSKETNITGVLGKCIIAMNNDSYFKLMFPKLGGLGSGMPHHTEYREAIIARLGGRNV